MQIKEIHYRNISGELLWKDKMVFRRLWGIGNEFIYNWKNYIIKRVAIADGIQHVNIEEVK